MDILEILKSIVHPETGQDIVSMGMVEKVSVGEGRVSFTLRMTRAHDPAASSLRRASVAAVEAATGIVPSVLVAEPAPVNKKEEARKKLRDNSGLHSVRHVVAISSGKGGVGKSSITANTAIALAKKGYKVGVVDADIYGPSMPTMFGLKGYSPIAVGEGDGKDVMIEPGENYGVKVMSIGFFIKDTDALVWRGPMATSALRQLLHQTLWGELDFLLIDMPPGTGDVHLTVVGEVHIDGAIIVTTPQLVALADVVRGIEMFRAEHVNVPVLGIVENMSWFEPETDKRYYIFGKGKIEQVATQTKLDVIASVPIFEELAAGADQGTPLALEKPGIFEGIVQKIVQSID